MLGMGDPLGRNMAIQTAVNEAFIRGYTLSREWSPLQRSIHFHTLAEAIGAMANNISFVATSISASEDLPILLAESLRGDLRNCLTGIQYCIQRVIEDPVGEADHPSLTKDIHLASMLIEHLNVETILRSKNLTLLPGAVDPEHVSAVKELGSQLLPHITGLPEDATLNKVTGWLTAKLWSLLSLVDEDSTYDYTGLASAVIDAGTSIEIAKLGIQSIDSLRGQDQLLQLIDDKLSYLASGSLWSEEHRRALATVQLHLHAAVLRSIDYDSRDLVPSFRWLSALRNWSVGTHGTANPNELPTLHLVASDDRLLRFRFENGEVDIVSCPLPEEFWPRVIAAHSAFDGTGTCLINKSFRGYLEEVLQDVLHLDSSQKYTAALHGRVGLIPWFALKPKHDSPWPGTVVLQSSPYRVAPATHANDSFLAIIDESFDVQAKEAWSIWRSYSGESADLVTINSTKDSASQRDTILSKLRNAGHVLFFGHGQSEMSDYRKSGLRIGVDEWITPNEISALDLSPTQELLLIACQSGRTNVGVPLSSIGEAFAARGTQHVISTLWSIESRIGCQFLRVFTKQMKKNTDVTTAWAASLGKDPARYGSFVLHAQQKRNIS